MPMRSLALRRAVQGIAGGMVLSIIGTFNGTLYDGVVPRLDCRTRLLHPPRPIRSTPRQRRQAQCRRCCSARTPRARGDNLVIE